jgi:anti-anti-sigma factor
MANTSAQDGGTGDEPEVGRTVAGDVVSLTVRGELTESARRPLVRTLTEVLLSGQPLRRVELRLADVDFLNSAGLAVLVQLQKMTAPRGVELVLVEPSSAVTRPLQLSGLWHRFPIVDENGDRESAGSPREGT